MTSRLRAALEDLADDAPAAPDLAARSWAAGRTRRLRRRVGLSVLTVAAVAAVAQLVPPALNPDAHPPVTSTGHDGVDHYPQRVGYWRAPSALPDKPGPLAGTFLNNNFGNAYGIGVNSAGKTWKLGSVTNALSPDGRLLLALQPQRGKQPMPLLLHDLTTGTRKVFDDIGDDPYNDLRKVYREFRYRLDSQAPISWAPDRSRVLLSAAERSRPVIKHPMVLDLRTGALTALDDGVNAGFRSAFEPVTARKLGGRTAKGGIALTTTDLRSGSTTVTPLRLDEPWRSDEVGLSASISPDGSTLVLIQNSSTLRLFSMEDGHELPSRTVSHLDCSTISWLGDDPVLPTKRQGHPAQSVQVTADGSRSLVALHPRLQSRCIQWAADALQGGPAWHLFGRSTAWWTWYWYFLLPVVAVPLLAVVLLWRRRRRA